MLSKHPEYFKNGRDGGPDVAVGGLLASYMTELFVWLGRIRDGTVDEEVFREEVAQLRDHISLALEVGAKAAEKPERFEQLPGLEEAMWTFLDELWRHAMYDEPTPSLLPA